MNKNQALSISISKDDKSVTFGEFVDFLNKKMHEHDKEKYPNLCQDDRPYEVAELDFGKKYVRVVLRKFPYSDSRRCYCFLDYDGNIYKSASWKAPAKHIRGTLFDDNFSWGKALGRYGAAYLR